MGGAVGLPLGIYLLLNLPEVGFRIAIGGLVAAYAAYRLLSRPVTIGDKGRPLDVCLGFVGGITGGLAAFPSAPVTIWCSMKGWDKARQRGIYQPFILIMQVAALGIIQIMHSSGMHGASLSLGALEFVPAAVVGTWFGLRIFRRMSDRHFIIAVNGFLLIAGIGLLI
ncbi:MAG: sulfite exporter TauE/SafE family protein [Acetobacteraceae bacterium]